MWIENGDTLTKRYAQWRYKTLWYSFCSALFKNKDRSYIFSSNCADMSVNFFWRGWSSLICNVKVNQQGYYITIKLHFTKEFKERADKQYLVDAFTNICEVPINPRKTNMRFKYAAKALAKHLLHLRQQQPNWLNIWDDKTSKQGSKCQIQQLRLHFLSDHQWTNMSPEFPMIQI